MKSESNWTFDDIFIVLMILAIVVGFIVGCCSERRDDRKYGEKLYEFVIVDKYETLGSNWHLIGGRATETEYHIIYKYHVSNRPDDKNASQWRVNIDNEVPYAVYRKYKVGDQVISRTNLLP